jgi:hypothetical protein
VKSKKLGLQPQFTGLTSLEIPRFVTTWCACGWRALSREPSSDHSEPKMNTVNADIVDVAISEGGVTFPTYFADKEPIDGKLTVVDLTDGSCRWPTGNPRDLKTFRYCGEAAQNGPYCPRHAQLAYLPRLPRAA